MKRRTFNFVYNNLYSLGGVIIVSGIYVFTGVLMAPVIGYVVSVGVLEILPRVLR